MINFSKCHKNDWICSSCSNVVYGNNNKIICICGQTKYNSKSFNSNSNTYTWRIGDKLCNNCNEWNFKKNDECRNCKQKI